MLKIYELFVYGIIFNVVFCELIFLKAGFIVKTALLKVNDP